MHIDLYHRLPVADIANERNTPVLPDYTIRESARAKHIRVQVTAAEGIVVVIPRGFDQRRIPELLKGKQAWLARALQQIETQRAAMLPLDHQPSDIEFPAVGETWHIDWSGTDKSGASISTTGQFQLRISGPTHNQAAWQPALRRWLIERGREHLVPWTESLSQELGIPIQRVSIRCQKTRWGSYSTKGTVSLNAQLLFLPRQLARYILIHEICHAIHPNHSSKFWRLVQEWEPEADRLRRDVRRASHFVPGWARPSRLSTVKARKDIT
ncbi:M48 family metallopeptidase [Candidatus Bipolaricaulota bacterium]